MTPRTYSQLVPRPSVDHRDDTHAAIPPPAMSPVTPTSVCGTPALRSPGSETPSHSQRVSKIDALQAQLRHLQSELANIQSESARLSAVSTPVTRAPGERRLHVQSKNAGIFQQILAANARNNGNGVHAHDTETATSRRVKSQHDSSMSGCSTPAAGIINKHHHYNSIVPPPLTPVPVLYPRTLLPASGAPQNGRHSEHASHFLGGSRMQTVQDPNEGIIKGTKKVVDKPFIHPDDEDHVSSPSPITYHYVNKSSAMPQGGLFTGSRNEARPAEKPTGRAPGMPDNPGHSNHQEYYINGGTPPVRITPKRKPKPVKMWKV